MIKSNPILDFQPHPITTEGRMVVSALPGQSLAEVLREHIVGDHPVVVLVDGIPVDRGAWGRTIIEHNTVIQARLSVGDPPESNPLAVVLSIAVIVAAPYAAGLILPASAPGWVAAGVTAVLQTAGLLAVNAIFPPNLPLPPDAHGQPRQYTLSGGSNRARPHEPVLLVLGSHRVFPDVAAKEYVDFVGSAQPRPAGKIALEIPPEVPAVPSINQGPDMSENVEEPPQSHYYTSDGQKRYNEQYLYQIFDFGIGNLRIASERIGETPLTDFEDVTTQKQVTPITLVDGNVDTIPGGDLDPPTVESDQVTNHPLTRRTEPNTDRIVFHLLSQNFTVDDDGQIRGGANGFSLEYRLVGETDWTLRRVQMRSPSNDDARLLQRYSFDYEVASGQYEVRATLTTAESDDDDRQVLFATLFAVTAHQPNVAAFAGRNPYAMRIRATGQLYGRLENFSADVDQLIDVWDGSAWTPNQKTSNPAWILRKFWRGFRRSSDDKLIAGRGLSADRINDEELKAWGAFCTANSLECNLVITDRMTSRDVENQIARCGWASVTQSSGKRGVIWENDDQPVTALFTPANIVSGSLSIEYENEGLADEIVGTYLDKESEWGENTLRRLAPGTTNPERPATVRLEGITNGTQAAKELNRMAAQQFYHQRVISWETGDDGQPLFVSRGVVCSLGHQLAGGTVGGRLLSINTSRNQVTVSADVPVAGTLWIWDLSGDVHVSDYNRAGDTITLTTAIPDPPFGVFDDPLSYRYTAFDPSADPVKVRLTGIEHLSGGLFRLTARDEVAQYYDARTSDLTHRLLPDRGRYRPVRPAAVVDEIGGSKIYVGSVDPPLALGRNDDFYINNTTNVMWKKQGGLWIPQADFSGADVSKWRFGADEPANTLGNDGEYYFRSEGPQIWRKVGAAWSILIDFAGGRTTWHSGVGEPGSGLGKVGDQYFRFDVGYVYEKTSATYWTFRFDLTGTAGSSMASVARDRLTGIVTYTLSDGRTFQHSLPSGEDTPTEESIFIRTKTFAVPAIPPSPPDEDEHVPAGDYTDEESGVDAEWRYEYQLTRQKGFAGWGPYSRPSLVGFFPGQTTDDLRIWTEGVFYHEDERIYVLAAQRIGPYTGSLLKAYVCTTPHTAGATNRPPNTTYWRTGDGSETVADRPAWFAIAETNNLYCFELDWATGTGIMNYKGDVPASARAATWFDGKYLFSTSSGQLYEITDPSQSGASVHLGSLEYWRTDLIDMDGNPVPGFYQDITNVESLAYGSRGVYILARQSRSVSPDPGVFVFYLADITNPSECIHSGHLDGISYTTDVHGATLHGSRIYFAANRRLYRLNSYPAGIRGRWALTTDLSYTEIGQFHTNVNPGSLCSDGNFIYVGNLSDESFRRIETLNSGGVSADLTKLLDLPSSIDNPYAMAMDPGSPRSIAAPDVAPGIPPNLTATARSSTSVLLVFSRPASGTRPFVYHIQRATDEDFTNPIDVTSGFRDFDELRITIQRLAAGTAHWFRIKALGPGGESDWSDPVSVSTSDTPSRPTAPDNFSAVVVGGPAIRLSWDAPTVSAPGRFSIEEAVGSGSFQVIEPSYRLNTYIPSGSAPGTTYRYRVRKHHGGIFSVYTPILTVTIPTVVAGTDSPSPPRGFSAIPTDRGEVGVDWIAPPGAGPYQYQLRRATNEAMTQNLTTLINWTSAIEFDDTGLSDGTTYWWDIRARLTNDVTVVSDRIKTSATTLAAPAVAPSPPRNVSPVVAALPPDPSPFQQFLRVVDITWDAPASGTGDFTYTIQWDYDVSDLGRYEQTNLSARSFQRDSVVNGLRFFCRVKANGPGGDSPWSAIAHVDIPRYPLPPTEPRNLSAVYSAGAVVDLSFDAPFTGYPPITYRIERHSNPSFVGADELAAAQSGTSYSDSGPPGGFVAGGTYHYRVTPNNVDGDGPSAIALVRIPLPVEGVPADGTPPGSAPETPDPGGNPDGGAPEPGTPGE